MTGYFHAKTGVKYADEVTQELFDEFIFSEIEAGKKNNSLNSRIRGLRVFFKFCAEREYMKPIAPKLMKTDVEVKEPYTDAELQRLLKKPVSNRWAEWRTWASINYLLATGNRIGTIVQMKVGDINFEEILNYLYCAKFRHICDSPIVSGIVYQQANNREKIPSYFIHFEFWYIEVFLFVCYTPSQRGLRCFRGGHLR